MLLVKLSGLQIFFIILNRFVDTLLDTASLHPIIWHEARKGHY